MKKTISISDVSMKMQGCGWQLIDVRSPLEFASGHIAGAINVPMDQLDSRMADLGRAPLLLICQRGQRAAAVAARLDAVGREAYVIEGGTQAWKDAGHPVVRCVKTSWSLERQVRLGAGVMIIAALLLAWRFGAGWLAVVAFVGAGMGFAGITDFCPMGTMLARMPWNRSCNPGIVPKITDFTSGPRA